MTHHAKHMLPKGAVWTSSDLLLDKNITGTDLKVFLGLCSYANTSTDSTFVGQTTLSEKLHLSNKTVVTSLLKLEELGYIKVERRCRKSSKGRTTNLYTIVNKRDEDDNGTESDSTEEIKKVPEQHSANAEQAPKTNPQTTLFNLPQKPEQKSNSRDESIIMMNKILADDSKGLVVDTDSITLLDLCYLYQHLHKEIIGYHVSVNKTENQSQGRLTSMQYMEIFMERYGLTVLEATRYIPRILTEFKNICVAEGRKKSEWLFHIGLLTWSGSNADIEKIMQKVKPKQNDKYAHLDDNTSKEVALHTKSKSSGIVF